MQWTMLLHFLPPVPDMSETPALMPPRSRQPSLRSHASEDLPVFPGKLLYQSVLHTPFYRGSYRHAVLAMFYASSSIPHPRRVPDSDEVLPQQALRYVPYPRKDKLRLPLQSLQTDQTGFPSDMLKRLRRSSSVDVPGQGA